MDIPFFAKNGYNKIHLIFWKISRIYCETHIKDVSNDIEYEPKCLKRYIQNSKHPIIKLVEINESLLVTGR